MSARGPDTRNRLGFAPALHLMTSYAQEPVAAVQVALPFSAAPILQKFMDASRCSRSLKIVRAAVTHFEAWLAQHDLSLLSANAETLERFRLHDCKRLGRKSNAHSHPRYIGILSRLLLYLQYQGFSCSHGWSGEDAALCLDFRKAFVDHGSSQAYADRIALQGIHLIAWSRLHDVSPLHIDTGTIVRFAAHDCRCGIVNYSGKPIPSYSAKRYLAASRFVRFLAGGDPVLIDGVVARVTRRATPTLTNSAAAYRDWLIRHRGLRPSTVNAYTEELLRWQHHLGEDACCYTAVGIRNIARNELKGRSPTRQSRFITVMRSYLRFRAGRGDCPASLVHALISRPVYSRGTVPRSLPFDTLRRVIDGCDRGKSVGIRDRAVLTLLLETGMRADEVAQLKLDDIDWERAQLKIHGKAGRAAVMPLTQGVGEAILDWLERGRPVTPDDSLFVRLRRPFVGLSCRGAITGIAVQALKRANLSSVGGAHLFRHSLARQLLKEGSGLPDIAGVLRHQHVDTTMIYAKVDDVALAAVARPWPGAGL